MQRFNHQILLPKYIISFFYKFDSTVRILQHIQKKEKHIHCINFLSYSFSYRKNSINHFVKIKTNSSTKATASTARGQREEDFLFSGSHLSVWLSEGRDWKETDPPGPPKNIKTPEALVFPRGTPLCQSVRSRRWLGRSASSNPAPCGTKGHA